MRKLIKHIPNTITSMNLLCGVIGVIFTLDSRFDIAFPLMLAAALFDFCDGLAARALNAYSDIGKELDSLADMVSFGVLPSLMLYKTMMNASGSLFSYITLILAVFSALRLAKFNIDTRQSDSFIGLATPSAAMICGSLTYFIHIHPESLLMKWSETFYFLPLLAIVLSALLVSEIPMFAMKFGKGHKADSITKFKRMGFLTITFIIATTVLCLGYNWSLIILLMFVTYIIMNILFLIFKPTRE